MTQSSLTRQLTIILKALMLQGVHRAVIAPGSRSTPIALALAQLAKSGEWSLSVDVDERSAGFLALGQAKARHAPVLLVCTSGTAAANFYPAICEAARSHIPLIVLTTDRPPELTNIGAPQALDQDHFYGQQVKDFLQLPLASTNQDEQQYVGVAVQRAVLTARQRPQGPVHLNLPLRKPLMPELPVVLPNIPAITRLASNPVLVPEALAHWHSQLAHQRGVILAGPDESGEDASALLTWATASGWPIIADPLSQLRDGQSAPIIYHTDALLTSGAWPTALNPDVMIRLGATPVSAAVADWLRQVTPTVLLIDPNQGLNDHTKTTTVQVPVTTATFFKSLTPLDPLPGWLTAWQQADRLASRTFTALSQKTGRLTEPVVATTLAATVASHSHLFVSNSMPIRDIDRYFRPQAPGIRIMANRGANGIDGIISTALGMASVTTGPSLLLTGDLAFFHDMNGLMMARRDRLSLRILVINNNGGGIFSFLPQAGAPGFETVFGTPQDLPIDRVAALYAATYHRITSRDDLAAALAQPISGLDIIEVPTDREENVTEHRRWQAQLKEVLSANDWSH